MERRSFLRSAILAAGFITVAPHLAFPKRLHEDEIEWFVYTQKEPFVELVSVSAIHKGDRWDSEPLICQPGKIDHCIIDCKKAIIWAIERHHDIPRGT